MSVRCPRMSDETFLRCHFFAKFLGVPSFVSHLLLGEPKKKRNAQKYFTLQKRNICKQDT